MPTKTEYREYIASKEWRTRRSEFLKICGRYCKRCWIPRWLAVVAYDQDLHVHHKSYAHVGAELDEDLESLCRRCHEIETFGVSALHKPQHMKCTYCERGTYRLWPYPICEFCAVMREYLDHFDLWELRAALYPGTSSDMQIWTYLILCIVQCVSWEVPENEFREACDWILWVMADEEKRRSKTISEPILL
jgi:HNH endonuclease